MPTRNRIFDDISQLMNNAVGVAQGAKDEAENAMKGWVDRWLADRDFVTREEFEAVRAMAEKARTENEVLKARLDSLESAAKSKPAPAAKAKPAPAAKAKPRARAAKSAAKTRAKAKES